MSIEKNSSNVDNEEVKDYKVAPAEAGAENLSEEQPQGSKKKKIWRIVGWCFAGLLAVLVLAFIFRDQIVTFSVRKIGSMVVGTKVELASFNTSLKGSVELKGFKVANPVGYDTPYAVELDRVFIKIAPSTVLTDEPVVETFALSGLRIFVETRISDVSLNLTDIQANAEKFAGVDKKKAKTEEKPVAEVENKKSAPAPAPLIKKADLSEMRIYAVTVVGKVPFPVGPVSVSNVGGKGKTWSEVSQMLFGDLWKVLQNVIGKVRNVANSGVDAAKALGSGIGKGAIAVGQAGKEAGKAVGSGLQKGVSAVGDAGKSVGTGLQKGVSAVGDAGKSIGKGVTDLFRKK